MRVWVPGCASGEEAYSLAILLMEEVAAARKNCAVQVFATDIDEEALKFARLGVYPESIVADVEADRLSKFFVRKDSGYQISDALRKSVVFAAQNLITDPPFSKMDIISCRNLLIYLDADTQTKLMPLMNFALNPGGYLFLGKSEGIGGRSDLFDIVSKKARLYRRLAPARPIATGFPDSPARRAPRRLLARGAAIRPAGRLPRSIATDVEARLAKFFVRKESGYQISEALRKSVVFATQNLIADPPFSKMDLISCRNLLIYLDADTQTRLMPLFNFALNPGGYLFLGKSEGIGGRNDLFDIVSKKARLYRRLAPARPIALDSPILPGRKRTIADRAAGGAQAAGGRLYGRDPAGPFEPLFRQRRVG